MPNAQQQFCNSGGEVLKSTFVLRLNFCTLAEWKCFDCPAIAKLPAVGGNLQKLRITIETK